MFPFILLLAPPHFIFHMDPHLFSLSLENNIQWKKKTFKKINESQRNKNVTKQSNKEMSQRKFTRNA